MDISVRSASTSADLDALADRLRCLDPPPSVLVVQCNPDLDPAPLVDMARTCAIPLIGSTSCGGAISDAGVVSGATVFCLQDPDGEYGVALRPLGADPEAAGREAARAALLQAGRPGEAPDLVWISATPGHEEAVLRGIESVVGRSTPILGGSAADNRFSGGWFVFDGDQTHGAAVVVLALFPSGSVSYAFHSGYMPREKWGVVTRAEGRRVFDIDGRPAAEVYSDWTDGAVPAQGPAVLISKTARQPLGRQVFSIGGVPFHLLAQPIAVGAEGALHLFADVEEGEALVQMSGSPDALVSRPGRVAAIAKQAADFDDDAVVGALIVYCASCMMTVRDRRDDIVAGLRAALPGVPFAGHFSYGEQGPLVGAGNRHGNLMIGCVVFGK